MQEPAKTAIDVIANGSIHWVGYVLLVGWAVLAGGVSILWWFIRRMIIKIDASHTQEQKAMAERMDDNVQQMRSYSGRLRAMENSAVRRTDHEIAMREIYQRIEDGNRESRQRLDKVLELLMNNSQKP